jgi:Fic family protein
MSQVVRRRWASDLGAPSREARRPCEYGAYVPDRLAGREIALDGSVAAEVSEAEAAIARLNVDAAGLVDTEALSRILLRAESIASSKIEGLEIGARRLLRAEAARDLGDQHLEGRPITVELLLDLHRRLLAASRLVAHGGHLRDVQNWIGGSDYNPCSAAFVPPPPEAVADLMGDLVAFCNEESLPTVAQAALAHAQFETIHPFVDGNGRIGRALIQLVFRRRGLTRRVLPPVSLVLATWAKDYVGGLAATRYRGPATSRAAHEGMNLWVGRFASACTRAVADAERFEQRARAIKTEWRERLGRVRARSATELLLRGLVGAPIVTVNSGSDLIHRSFVQTNEAVGRLVDAGILNQVTVGRRNRAFEAPDIIAAFTDFERQLASPGGDTRTSKPARPVPRRRRGNDIRS